MSDIESLKNDILTLRRALQQGLAFLEQDAIAGPDGEPQLSQDEFNRLMDAWGESAHNALRQTEVHEST